MAQDIMARTLQDRYLLALLARGESVAKELSGCIVVTRRAGGFYYLGYGGSVRYGATRSGSKVVSSKFKSELLQAESNIHSA